MNSKLKKVTLSQIASFKYGKTIRKQDIDDVGTYPVFSGYRVVGYTSKYMYEDSQLVIVCRGVGGTGDVKLSPEKCSITNLAIVVNCNSEIIDKNYLYWRLKLSDTYSLRTGSAQPQITINTLENFEIDIEPSLEKQKEIARQLFTINKKIELNSNCNTTLETIAQTLFKSWFVDFDPVKAKLSVLAAGGSAEEAERAAMCAISARDEASLNTLQTEQPEAYAELARTAALFPSAMQSSELGEIPDGWSAGYLLELCNLNQSSWTKKNAPESVWYVDLANAKNGVIEEIQQYQWKDAPSRAKRILTVGDTIVGTVRPGNRSFAYIGGMSYPITASTGFAVLSPKKDIYAELVYIAATSDENIERLAHLADGAAYPAVRPDVVTQLLLSIPPEPVIEAFNKLMRPLFLQKHCNLSQQEHLNQLRNTVLPKLLSGELTVTDATPTKANPPESGMLNAGSVPAEVMF